MKLIVAPALNQSDVSKTEKKNERAEQSGENERSKREQGLRELIRAHSNEVK